MATLLKLGPGPRPGMILGLLGLVLGLVVLVLVRTLAPPAGGAAAAGPARDLIEVALPTGPADDPSPGPGPAAGPGRGGSGAVAGPGAGGPRQGTGAGPLRGGGAGARESLEAAEAEPEGRARRPWSGAVRDQDTSLPVEGAVVSLEGGGLQVRARTGAEGTFALEWYEGLEAELVLKHAEYVDQRAPAVDLEQPGEFELQRSARILGWVDPPPAGEEGGGSGVAYAWQQTASSQKYWEAFDAALAADGSFAFGDLEPGQYAVTALHPGSAVELEFGLTLESGETREVRLGSAPGSVVYGRLVRRDTLEPVAAALVRAEPRTKGMPGLLREASTAETLSDDDGSYELAGLGAGAWRLTVELPWGGTARDEVDVLASGDRFRHDFELAGPARLLGLVVDPDGHGVPGARVVAFSKHDGARVAAIAAGDFDERTTEATADGSGRFELVDLPPSVGLVVAAYPPDAGDGAGVPGYAQVDPLAPGELGAGVQVELPPFLELEGRVTDEYGEPVPGAEIQVEYPFNKRGRIRLRGAESDAEGRFELGPLLVGTAVVRARRDGYREAREVVPVEPGGDGPEELELVLSPALEVSGLALDEAGFGIGGLPVRIELEQPAPGGGQGGEKTSKGDRFFTATDGFGRFTFRGVREGAWRVWGSSYEWQMVDADPEVLDVPQEAEVILTFAPRSRPDRAALRGLVAVEDGSLPVGLRIQGLQGGVLTVDGGRFEATGLVPTRHRLRVFADGCVPHATGAIDLGPGQERDVGVIELLRATELEVLVSMPDGTAIQKAKVLLEPLPAPSGGLGEEAGNVKLGPAGKGRYRTPHAPRAYWTLRVKRDGFRTHTATLQILAEEAQSVAVVLEPKAKKGKASK